MTRLLLYLAVLVVVALVALWWRRVDGRLRATGDRFTPDQLSRLHIRPGVAALVEFTSPHCAPCVATRRILDEVAARFSATVAEVDIAHELDLARAHHVLRAPTTFVVAPDGQVLGRVSGVPVAADLAALLSDLHRASR